MVCTRTSDLRIGSNDDGITWFELEEANRFSSTPLIAVNQVFSDELEVDVGDSVQLGWFVRNANGVERVEANFTIHHIAAMAGKANSLERLLQPSLPTFSQRKNGNNLKRM